MIVLTGAAGFIGSCMLRALNDKGIDQIILSDAILEPAKRCNIENKKYLGWINRDGFLSWSRYSYKGIKAVIHLGARTDTTETDTSIFDRLNYQYSIGVWQLCTRHQIPLIYASSAATYGKGDKGYSDDHSNISQLSPLNAYGHSKHNFDLWALQQTERPPQWYGLKFFNVYGPNEYHKGRMASVVYHAHRQIATTGAVNLFKSHRSDYRDGEQLRDFIYVKDLINVCFFLLRQQPESGIYNVGTGKTRTFLDLAKAVFAALALPPDIRFIDTPENIRESYQYYTQAEMQKLRSVGYTAPFHTLEQGVADYVTNYLNMPHGYAYY
ncbi:MAG: ADP-glyceromanno-heptose 6-epimerase [Chitinophagales bacterium]|nr:ADP-glyceromanno-heptose 6-epimerase [Chitinophagales bacterium]